MKAGDLKTTDLKAKFNLKTEVAATVLLCSVVCGQMVIGREMFLDFLWWLLRTIFTLENRRVTQGDKEVDAHGLAADIGKRPAGTNLYPNCDVSIWLRSCKQEVIEPIEGVVSGSIPSWLKGTLLRNGPGKLSFGDTEFKHLFDGSALLHRYSFSGGRITYQNRFLQSQTFRRNMAAQRIVVTEFGTTAVPDPCQTIFQSVASIFRSEDLSDNAMISIYPIDDAFYAFTEAPYIHRINPETLETLDRVDVSEHVAIVNHSSHPHITEDGTVYNVGLQISMAGTKYCIVKFPSKKSTERENLYDTSFNKASIIASLNSRWRMHPSYMHTFGITENYFVILEQPLCISIPAVVKNKITSKPMAANLKWHENEETEIHLLSRQDGSHVASYRAKAFFFLHIINCYENRNEVIVDICCYKDSSMLNCMYIEALKSAPWNPNYAGMFRGRPLRFVLPLSAQFDSKDDIKKSVGTKDKLFVTPEILCDIGCETPRVYYESYCGKKYRYFYAISSDVDADNPGTLIKVDTKMRTYSTWCEDNVYASEPVFIPSPEPKCEDDGLVVSALIWGKGLENKAGVLILDARSWAEIGRAEFITPSPVPKCLHGWFAALQ